MCIREKNEENLDENLKYSLLPSKELLKIVVIDVHNEESIINIEIKQGLYLNRIDKDRSFFSNFVGDISYKCDISGLGISIFSKNNKELLYGGIHITQIQCQYVNRTCQLTCDIYQSQVDIMNENMTYPCLINPITNGLICLKCYSNERNSQGKIHLCFNM